MQLVIFAVAFACSTMFGAIACARVSVAGQETDSQAREILDVGFSIALHRIIAETVSGSAAMARRLGFSRLLDRKERQALLVVTKLDRLERDAIDVSMTVENRERWASVSSASPWTEST